MTVRREPPRLFEAAADAELRAALQTIRSDTPELSALVSLAERTTAAVLRSSASEAGQHAGSSASARRWAHLQGLAKLTLVSCSAGVLYLATQRGFAPPPAARAPQPSAAERSQPPAVLGAPPTPPAAAVRARDSSPGPVPDAVDTPTAARSRTRAEPPADPSAHAQPRTRRSAGQRGSAQQVAALGHPAEAASPNAPPGPPAPIASHARKPVQRGPLDELMQLEEAQRVLVLDPQRALTLLNQHAERYPQSRYEQEREVLILDVLSRLRRMRELHERAQAFQRRHPGSAHQVRVDAILEDRRR